MSLLESTGALLVAGVIFSFAMVIVFSLHPRYLVVNGDSIAGGQTNLELLHHILDEYNTDQECA